MDLVPVGAEFILVCMPALPPAILLAFDANGLLVGLAYIGNPRIESAPTKIPAAVAAPVKPKLALPTLPIAGQVGDKPYELEP